MGKPLADSIFGIKKSAWAPATSPKQGRLISSHSRRRHTGGDRIRIVRAYLLCSAVERTLLAGAALLNTTALVGNTALIKHAESVQGCAEALENLVRDAGGPEGLYVNLAIRLRRVPPSSPIRGCGPSPLPAASAPAALLRRKPPKSERERCWNSRFRSLHRSGGRRPCEAVQLAVTSRYFNNSEGCICAKRFLVAESLFDDFTKAFVEQSKALPMGDP